MEWLGYGLAAVVATWVFHKLRDTYREVRLLRAELLEHRLQSGHLPELPPREGDAEEFWQHRQEAAARAAPPSPAKSP